MKKVMALSLVVFAFCATTFAQNDKPHDGKFNQEMKQQLKDSLQLTDAQADSVSTIEQSFRPQMRDIMRDESLSKDDRKQKLQALRADEKARLQAVLSEDQITKLEAMQKSMRQRMRNRNGGNTTETNK